MLREKWENVDDGGGGYRLKVPDGWIVRYGNKALCFVPDAEHYWGLTDAEIKKLQAKQHVEFTEALDKFMGAQKPVKENEDGE